METQLLDREIEMSDITEIINASPEINKIILLKGISGVGKSSLVEKLSQNPSVSSKIISVKISKSSVDTIENQQYFNAVYKTITKYAKNKMFDKVLSPTQHGLINTKNIFKILINLIKNKLGINEIALTEPEEDESIIKKKDYLVYILKKTNIILDIENIQNIDTQSFEILKEIIRDLTGRTFIFEYTTTKNNYKHYEHLYKELAELNAQLHCYHVKKMDFSIAKKLAPQNISINEDYLNDSYNQSEGNLMEIILASDNVDKESSNINLKLRSLSKNEKYILYIVYLNDSPIAYEDLAVLSVVENQEKIIKDFEQLKKIIDDLCVKKILIINNNYIKIKHDSIIDHKDFMEHII